MIHFITPGEGTDLIEKALRSIFTCHGLEWQSFSMRAKIDRCILDDLVAEPLQLILSGADAETIEDFYHKPEQPYLPVYAEEIGDVPVHLWYFVSPVGSSPKKAIEFARRIAEANFLANFRWTFLVPKGFESITEIIGNSNVIILHNELTVKLSDFCYTMGDGAIGCSLMPGKARLSATIEAQRLIKSILEAVG